MPSIYLAKKEYDALLRRGEEPAAVVAKLVATHLEEVSKKR